MVDAGFADEQQGIADFLDVLEKHRLDCERQGKYDEAELAKARVEQLRLHEEKCRREELNSQQQAERLEYEEAHNRELQELTEQWDSKFADYEGHAENLQNTLRARHKQEHANTMEKYRTETEPRTPRWSRDLLNLRKIQESLAKQKKYSEAKRTKDHADAMEMKEHAAWKAKRERKIELLEEQYLHKQDLEMGGLVKRINSGRSEHEQTRKAEMERILQRYQNLKTQLDNQQKIIQQRVEKYPVVTPVGMSVSRPSSRLGIRPQSPRQHSNKAVTP